MLFRRISDHDLDAFCQFSSRSVVGYGRRPHSKSKHMCHTVTLLGRQSRSRPELKYYPAWASVRSHSDRALE
jgi:hypothetical protein